MFCPARRPKYLYKGLRRGVKPISIFAFFDFRVTLYLHFHPKHPNEGLKWPWECFLLICKIQNFLSSSILGEFPNPRKIFFSKKISGDLGMPLKWKKEENCKFYKSIENILMVILSPHWGVLGEKWRYSVTRKSKNAKIEIGLNPPPP